MSQAQILDALGLSQAELTDLLTKFNSFTSSLDENQKSLLKKTLPTMEQAMQTLGPGVTAQDLQDAFSQGDSQSVTVCVCGSAPPPAPMPKP